MAESVKPRGNFVPVHSVNFGLTEVLPMKCISLRQRKRQIVRV